VELPRESVAGVALADVAVAAGLCKSKGEARRLAESGGLYLNNRRMDQPAAVVQPGDIVDGRIVVLRSGKKNFRLVRVQGG
jgi:tyrosyl-tRNA synthetase